VLEEQHIEGEQGEDVGREYMFLKVGVSNGRRLAMGVVYGRQAGDPGAAEWNERLFNQLQQEVGELQDEGYQVILGGDFNAHFSREGEGWTPRDRTGRLMEEFSEGVGLTIVNRMKCCEGQWTRITAQTKSTVDYFLVSGGLEEQVGKMFIDEGGEHDIASDHVAMWMDVNMKPVCNRGRPREGRWEISDTSDWEKFEGVVAREMTQVQERWGGDRGLDEGRGGDE
jgi:hypothetical protein